MPYLNLGYRFRYFRLMISCPRDRPSSCTRLLEIVYEFSIKCKTDRKGLPFFFHAEGIQWTVRKMHLELTIFDVANPKNISCTPFICMRSKDALFLCTACPPTYPSERETRLFLLKGFFVLRVLIMFPFSFPV